jgi:hypothetical protein
VLPVLILGEFDAVAIEMVDRAELVVVRTHDGHVLRDLGGIHHNAPAVSHGSPWRRLSIAPSDPAVDAPHEVDQARTACLALVAAPNRLV